MRALVTGSAGFIGFHVCRKLLEQGHFVYGFDGMTPYYNVRLKEKRTALLVRSNRFTPEVAMLEDADALNAFADAANPDIIIHLAAQAGVRYSLEEPRAYVEANVVGTFNVLEVARKRKVGHLLAASTSSVYGANTVMPFTEEERTDHPLTIYAATKKACEAMAHSYAHLWSIPTTMFRFFTVYGPWGRPDMALFKFVHAIERGEPIDIYNHGKMERDFTYIDDLVEAIVRLADCVPQKPAPGAPLDEPAHSPAAPFRVVNIGRGKPVNLVEFVDEIERKLGKSATRRYVEMQKGDVPATFADAALLERLTGFRPAIGVREGISAFVDWYQAEYKADAPD